MAAVGIPVSPHCTQVSFHPARVISATLVRLFQDGGHQVVATLRDAEELLATVARERPNLTVVDVRMPPTFTDEGARVAHAIKEQHPGMGVLVLSQHIETAHAVNLVALGGFGYLLKDRVLEVGEFPPPPNGSPPAARPSTQWSSPTLSRRSTMVPSGGSPSANAGCSSS